MCTTRVTAIQRARADIFFFFSPPCVGTFEGVASQSNLDDRFDSTKKQQHWLVVVVISRQEGAASDL